MNEMPKGPALVELKILEIPLLSPTGELRKGRKKGMMILASCLLGSKLALGATERGNSELGLPGPGA